MATKRRIRYIGEESRLRDWFPACAGINRSDFAGGILIADLTDYPPIRRGGQARIEKTRSTALRATSSFLELTLRGDGDTVRI